MKKTITFDQLPNEVTMLRNEISALKQFLITNQTKAKEDDKWLNLNDLIEYDPEKRTKATWYSKISKGEVPYHKKGKKVYFLKSEFDEWLKNGRKKTHSEIIAESENQLRKKI